MTFPADDDSAALFAASTYGGGLCTVTAIDGSWSRRLGAQLAVLPDGTTQGSLADGCLENALAEATRRATAPQLLRFGQGSPFIDVRLPCGSGIDVLVDPAPDRARLREATHALAQREPAVLAVGTARYGPFLRRYLPRLRLIAIGSGPELKALARLATIQPIDLVIASPVGEAGTEALALGVAPTIAIDRWTAIAVLFHDHEWERGVLPWALASPAFHVGAQGGEGARRQRDEMLAVAGITAADRARLRSPIGLFRSARSPSVLALSVLAEIVAAYEQLLDAQEP
ncbi:MAG: XdhC family protein [Sphingomonadales bacterium]|nr:XdhC family protein [Sphingomonadales bacterium]